MSLAEDINAALGLEEEPGVREAEHTMLHSYKQGLPSIRNYVNVRGKGYDSGAAIASEPKIYLNASQEKGSNHQTIQLINSLSRC